MLMVQSSAQLPMKNVKVKGPPPVPPRPNQSVVAEALAKTRKAVAESRANLTKAPSKDKQKQIAKAKTLERTNSSEKPSVSPKQNGLARVKSFIRDVISDRSSSSDEKRSSGTNSRRSSSDSSSIPVASPIKKSNESLNSKTVKTCKQILVRSFSTSNKLDQESKCKVTKSSSFADKTIPMRKAPPPPLSPKPKLKPIKAMPLPMRRNTLENKIASKPTEVSLYSIPIDARKPPQTSHLEAPYATVEEVQDFDDRLRDSPSRQDSNSSNILKKGNDSAETEVNVNNNNSLERKTSRVTEMLISEIIASRNNKNEVNTVIDKGKNTQPVSNGTNVDSLPKDLNNHEMLIYELQTMRSQSNVRETLENTESVDEKLDTCESEDSEANYAISSEFSGHTEDGNDQAYAYILDVDLKSRLRKQFRAISTMSLQGLPPLPKSLSGFAECIESDHSDTPSPEVPEKPPKDLDGQLAYLKKEMAGLRQLDLSLLSELWSLSEAMAAWRRQLERAPRLRPAPPPPPPPHYGVRT